MTEIVLVNPPGTKLIDQELPVGMNNIGPDRRYNTLAWPGAVAAWIKRHLPKKSISFVNMQDGTDEREHKLFDYERRKLLAFHTGRPLNELRAIAKESKTFLLHCNTTYEASGLVEAAKEIRTANPKSLILAGGMDVSARPKFYLQYVDTVVQGEIEAIDKEGLEAILNGKQHGVVAGQNFSNLDEIPYPALDILNLKQFSEQSSGFVSKEASVVYSIETTRGCPRACLFCTTSKLKGKYIRKMPPRIVEQHLVYLKSAGVNHVEIYDDAFSLGRSDDEIYEIMDIFRKVGIPFSWPNGSIEIGRLYEMGGQNRINKRLIKALYSNPCQMAYLSVDKVTEPQMKQYRRLNDFTDQGGFNTELEIIQAIASTGIPYLQFGLLIGTADESKEERELVKERALQICGKIKESNPRVLAYGHIFTSLPCPGTEHFELYKRLGALYPPEYYSPLWCLYIAHWKTKDATPGEVTKERDDIFLAVNGPEVFNVWRKTGRFAYDIE